MIINNDYSNINYFKPEYIIHNSKLILRISFKYNNQFIPMSFILDTSSTSYLYLSKEAKNCLKNRILCDDLNNEYIEVSLKESINRGRHSNWTIKEPPHKFLINDSSENKIGLKALMLFMMYFNEDSFNFMSLPDYL